MAVSWATLFVPRSRGTKIVAKLGGDRADITIGEDRLRAASTSGRRHKRHQAAQEFAYRCCRRTRGAATIQNCQRMHQETLWRSRRYLRTSSTRLAKHHHHPLLCYMAIFFLLCGMRSTQFGWLTRRRVTAK